jgi:hypothetical protein
MRKLSSSDPARRGGQALDGLHLERDGSPEAPLIG